MLWRMPPTPADPGPYFDDLAVGQVLLPAPAVTLDAGTAAAYQALCGDPLATSLSAPLGTAVSGAPGRLANPALVMHISIGQSTVATQRVVANLFYRGVVLKEVVRLGETLHTTVEVRGLRETTRRDDRPPRGLALLGIRTVRVDDGAAVVDYERCAMLRFRDPDSETGHADELGAADPDVDLDAWAAHVPAGWDASPLAGAADRDWEVGGTRADLLRDTVTGAPELARLSQNLAPVHRDAGANDSGRRLVYGGHTIGLAQASMVRLMPGTATVLGWQSCDHPGPVHEGDVLSCRHTLLDEREVAGGRLRAVRTEVSAERDGDDAGPVLDWRLVAWGA
ncbi:MAG: acyl dehydratase [Acidimicrobiaceae bacterium]|nr:acyl dehydratase [Acidimicrobiaceae bacterium]